ncbi:hypothetical protein EMIHUDRAFT_245754 [Emiliania huxleyi CCMP1516]|uniref:Dipeptidase n=2 Tax=Emiliania huxleyi TaxID=2903 RepID=A0A0D3IW96_EMIH1|nr:hypothetical protein EMIHUDRAFT_245754 [Emiliania huxleyi CCMP1516]EOD15531.1 hypothetical protein EMIHUDRAFT_245754 [Emiliania huxleyi CCMP1516]|eukprot:XP_005767960.1 hypothetical protein EMIHUDRAFT_245754 [Emiliania huxleyi CCMP1516]
MARVYASLRLLSVAAPTLACTNVLVTQEASASGNILLGYNDDSSNRYAAITRFPAQPGEEGRQRPIYLYDNGNFSGYIPDEKPTYNVISNSNEWGVVIAETTHGGLSLLDTDLKTQNDGVGHTMDYGSLIYTALQRSRTARDAIGVITSLTQKYGYSSAMEGFSITDGVEIWILEMIGKGEIEKGTLWLAKRLPPGTIYAHANQARLGEIRSPTGYEGNPKKLKYKNCHSNEEGGFAHGPPLVEDLATASGDPFDGKMTYSAPGSKTYDYVLDPDLDCMVSSNAGDGTRFDAAKRNLDPEEFALEQGLYDPKDGPFSFSDVFCPVDFGGARYCEARAPARVWNIFSKVAHPDDFDSAAYLGYAKGYDLANRMPEFVRVKKPISRLDVHDLLSLTYEGTWLDPAVDIGAGIFRTPQRLGAGLSWTSEGESYINERPVGTFYTAWHFVSEVRNSKRCQALEQPDWDVVMDFMKGYGQEAMPAPWDTPTNSRYAGADCFPPKMRSVTWWGAKQHKWSPKIPLYGGATKVSNLVYSMQSHVSEDVLDARKKFNDYAEGMLKSMDEKFVAMTEEEAQTHMDKATIDMGAMAVDYWDYLWQTLLAAYADGYTRLPGKEGDEGYNYLFEGTKKASEADEAWKKAVVADTGMKYRQPGGSCAEFDPDGKCLSTSRGVKKGGPVVPASKRHGVSP